MTMKRNLSAMWFWFRLGATVLAGLAGLIVVALWLSGYWQERIPPGASDREVQWASVASAAGLATDVVHEVEKETMEEAIGTLRAASRTVVSSRILATIMEVTVAAGSEVAEGAVLVRLDHAGPEARLRQSEQAAAAAQAARAEAQLAFDRAKKLLPQNAISQAEFDRANASLQVALAEEQRATEAAREAEILLSYTTLHAPRGGRIVERYAEPGDMARPGEPLLLMYDADSLRLEAPVKESLATQLHAGQELTSYIDAIGQELRAVISEIVPQADAPSRSFLVKADVPSHPALYEGMFGRLMIPAGRRTHLCLAAEAIRRIGQLEFVDVVDDAGGVEARLIQTGRSGIGGRVEVLTGLRSGERVLLHSPPPA